MKRPWWPWLAWIGLVGVITVVFVALREHTDRVHVALALLVAVLGASAHGGRRLGRSVAILAYLTFHYYFIEHYGSFWMRDKVDVLVLVAFLATALIAEYLVTQAQMQALSAQRRTAEVERLASLGAEMLTAGRADDAVRRIVEVIRESLGVARVDAVADVSESRGASSVGDAALEIGQASDATRLELPLDVHGRRVGVLRLQHVSAIILTSDQRRFLEVLSYYLALALERVRLVADAERAEALRHAEALRESLVAGVSHDFRTPLTAIKALANRLDQRYAPEAAAIEREADRLDRLASDVLDLSRLNAGALPLRPEYNTASDLIGAVLQRRQHEHDAGRVRVTLSEESDDEPLAGIFDFVQTLRILDNLLANALKYAPAGSPVELRAWRIGELLYFAVSDRGPGIPEQERERVFDAFYRVPGVPADTGGTGLGLAIARRLAREQGGEVRLLGRVGGGSEFELTLPASAQPLPLKSR